MKNLLCAALLAAALPAAAQPVGVGLEAGAYFANMKYKTTVGPLGNVSGDGDLKAGLRAGISLEARMTRGLWLQTGAFYVRKGAEDFLGADRIGIGYLQVPLYFVGKIGTNPTGRFFIGAGPYLAAAVGGSVKDNGRSRDLDFGNSSGDDFRRFDAGLGVTTGYEFPGRVYLRGNAEFGLANILPGGTSDNRIRNWGLGISLGYKLL